MCVRGLTLGNTLHYRFFCLFLNSTVITDTLGLGFDLIITFFQPCFILVRVKVDPEDGLSVHCRSPCASILKHSLKTKGFFLSYNLPTGMFWEVEGNWRTWRKPMRRTLKLRKTEIGAQDPRFSMPSFITLKYK